MLRSATFDTLLSNCTHVEQIIDLCTHALYNRYYPSAFITTGIEADGSDIRSLSINHWTGNQVIKENTIEEQLICTLVTKVNKEYKYSANPWLTVQPIGASDDTPNGIFA
ncbi:hypothetical protein [Cyanothece sp. BG0011]|uniref:hypothetical protein n=1 Tax=Cyanothece sp. BG0011 TaxID=2082950 RepID=UPI000D1F944E|nr:hypothetical protein [Cyanothece sp. BG0011]